MKRNFLTYILLCILSFTATSCKDDLLYNSGEVGEGECVISGTVKFKSFTPALSGNTRAEGVTGGTKGDAIKEINSLCVLLYDENENLLNKYFLMPKDATGADGADGVYEVVNVPRKDHTDNGYTDADGNPLPPAEVETPRATFTLKIPYGKYYIYAVANMGNLSNNPADTDLKSAIGNTNIEELIQTVNGLKSIPLQWNEGNIAANSQMFGHFFSDTNTDDAPLLTISKPYEKLQAWVRRAASKVTVAFDGSGLKKGVSIYIKALRIKNIPKSCLLGKDNTVGQASGEESSEGEGNEGETNKRAGKEGETDPNLVIPTGEEVTYSTSTTYDEKYPALITKEQPYYPRKETNEDGTTSWVMDPDAHSETNPHSLFFYENMQGSGDDKPDKRQIDGNNDGILDNLYDYKSVKYATYIEVDAYYESSNPERPGICNITYRFMLGQDVIKNYDAKRNCHYKLTLHFNGYADDPDWRIDYVTRLWVTQPETVNYKGEYFVPNHEVANLGDDFRSDNTITVTSFMYENDDWFKRIAQPYKIEYKESGSAVFTETRPTWLNEFTTTHEGNGVYKLKINYGNPYEKVIINEAFKPQKTGIYDLSTKGGTTKINTANCYVIDSKGTYQFPLVYGNAITDGVENSDSYTYKGWGSSFHNELYLRTFLNYKNVPIKSAYILDDLDNPSGLSASLVWQDESGLVTDIKYVSGGKGAIQFTIGDGIKEGNAVIALKNGNTIIWSWHIWVTAIDLSRTLTLTNHDNNKYEIMPVNLGWCSGGSPIRYYERHECEVKFTQLISAEGQQGISKIVKIIQEPHIAVPCGNNPYFQHGRKDPFMAGGGTEMSTKTWYNADGASSAKAPALMNAESVADDARTATYQATAALIQNPNRWQNGPRVPSGLTGENDQKYYPRDAVYFNLWDNSMWDDNDNVIKTIYDPCPAGYHVSSINTFTGFTAIGDGTTGAENMFAAIEGNMLPEYRTNLYEFYTDRTKLISIGFPQNGYRDWDDNAEVHRPGEGDVWHAQAMPFDWGNNPKGFPQIYLAYHLQFIRSENAVRPKNNFYATDGFAVRPTKTLP